MQVNFQVSLSWPRLSELCLKESHSGCQEVILLLCVDPVTSSWDLNKKGIGKQLSDCPDISITLPGRLLLPCDEHGGAVVGVSIRGRESSHVGVGQECLSVYLTEVRQEEGSFRSIL